MALQEVSGNRKQGFLITVFNYHKMRGRSTTFERDEIISWLPFCVRLDIDRYNKSQGIRDWKDCILGGQVVEVEELIVRLISWSMAVNLQIDIARSRSCSMYFFYRNTGRRLYVRYPRTHWWCGRRRKPLRSRIFESSTRCCSIDPQSWPEKEKRIFLYCFFWFSDRQLKIIVWSMP